MRSHVIPLHSILFYAIVSHSRCCFGTPHPPTVFFPFRGAFLKPSLPMPHRCPRWPSRAMLARTAVFLVFWSPEHRAISSCSTLFHCTPYYPMACYPRLFHGFHCIQYYSMLFHAILCYSTLFHAIPRYPIVFHVSPWHSMLFHANLR